MKRTLLLILAAPMLLLAQPRAASAQQIYWYDANFAAPKLSRANPDGSSPQSISLTAQSLPQGLDFDVTGAEVYGSELAYVGAHLNKVNVNLIGLAPISSGLSCLRGVAVDGNGGMVYWASTNLITGTLIQRAGLDGSNPQVLFSVGPGGGCAPRGIALDLAHQMLYVADFDDASIEKMPMAGGPLQAVLTGLAGPCGLAIDPQAGRMYWTEANSNMIRAANLDGTSPATLVTGLATPNYLALDPISGVMFWTEIGTPRIMKANMTGSGVTQLPLSVVAPSGIGFLPVNTTPVTIASLVAVPGHGYVDLQWAAFVAGSPRFQVFRAEGESGSFAPVGAEIDATGRNSFSFQDRGVRPGTEYRYQVGYREQGAWQYSGITRVATPAAVFAFRAISPNPAPGAARLDYELASSGPVRLDIYDLSGRLVRTVVDGVAEAGVRSATWDGRSSAGEPVAAGAYFARLTSGARIATRRLMLVR